MLELLNFVVTSTKELQMKVLNKKRKLRKTTTSNREYKAALKSEGVDCPICQGKCGYGPYRANKWKRNCGKKPRYKNIDRRSIKDFMG